MPARPATPSPLLSLPTEILVKALALLSKPNLARCSQVCKLLHHIIYNHALFWAEFDFPRTDALPGALEFYRHRQASNQAHITKIIAAKRLVQTPQCNLLAAANLRIHLTAAICHHLTASLFDYLQGHVDTLRNLHLQRSFAHLGGISKSTEELLFSFPHLVKLHLSEITMDPYEGLSLEFSHLEEIELDQYKQEGRGPPTIQDKFPRLKKASISNCHLLSRLVYSILRSQSLETLITDLSTKILPDFGKIELPNLVHLSILGDSSRSIHGYDKPWPFNPMPLLKSLTIQCLHIPGSDFIDNLLHSPLITHFDVKNMTGSTDLQLMALIAHWPLLQRLTTRNAFKISKDTINTLKQHSLHLKHLAFDVDTFTPCRQTALSQLVKARLKSKEAQNLELLQVTALSIDLDGVNSLKKLKKQASGLAVMLGDYGHYCKLKYIAV